jgi:hypothetical protein
MAATATGWSKTRKTKEIPELLCDSIFMGLRSTFNHFGFFTSVCQSFWFSCQTDWQICLSVGLVFLSNRLTDLPVSYLGFPVKQTNRSACQSVWLFCKTDWKICLSVSRVFLSNRLTDLPVTHSGCPVIQTDIFACQSIGFSCQTDWQIYLSVILVVLSNRVTDLPVCPVKQTNRSASHSLWFPDEQMDRSACLSLHLSICPSVHPSTCPSLHSSVHSSIRPSDRNEFQGGCSVSPPSGTTLWILAVPIFFHVESLSSLTEQYMKVLKSNSISSCCSVWGLMEQHHNIISNKIDSWCCSVTP